MISLPIGIDFKHNINSYTNIMFTNHCIYITINGSNPNIINYERVLQNKYSQWEQELIQRESVIREKERELLYLSS